VGSRQCAPRRHRQRRHVVALPRLSQWRSSPLAAHPRSAGRAGGATSRPRGPPDIQPGHRGPARHNTRLLGFARDEIRVRKALQFPPYARLCVCTFAHKDDHEPRSKSAGRAQRGSDTLGMAPGSMSRSDAAFRTASVANTAGRSRCEAQTSRGHFLTFPGLGAGVSTSTPGRERRQQRGSSSIVLVSDHNDVLTTKAIRVPRVT